MRRLLLAAATAVACAAVPAGGALRAQQAEQGPQVDSVEVTGNHRVSSETILNAAGIPLHTPITFRDIQRAIRALVALNQFDDVQVGRHSGQAGEEILILTVRERPLLARVTVRGVVKLGERSVRDKLQDLTTGRPLDPAAVELSRLRIDSLYETQGYYLAQVRPILIPQDSTAVRLVFDVTEGRRVAVAAVRIEGNRAFRARQVVHAMKTRPEGFFWFQRGEYSETALHEDLEQRLPEFYGSRGYIDFRVVRDTLIVDEGSGKATLLVQVDEGQPYRVGTVTVEGNRFFSTEQVMSLNPFAARGGSGLHCLLGGCHDTTNAFFDQHAWDDATTKLRTQYANEGYIYAEIRPEIQRTEPTAGDSVGRVNVSWLISEGRPAIVNRVDIVGNETTHERVIREAISILPGDVFSQDRILRSYQQISNLGFFEQPLPFPDTKPANDQGDIDLVFHVQEKHTGSVNFGASVGQGTGVGGFLGLEEPNLFGQGKRGRLQWQFGRNINDFNLTYSDPSLFDSRVSGTVELNNSRVRYTIADLGQIFNRGISLQVGVPLPRSRYSRLFLTSSLDWQHYTGAASTISAQTSVCQTECLRTMLGASLVRDTRIDLPFPTGGSYHQISFNLNGPFHTGSATFQRADMEGRWYAPVARIGGGPTVGGIKVVLALTTKAGFVFGDPGPFFQQEFAMGGTQYGIPLRGYDEFSITPQGYNPNASLGGVPRSAFGKSYFLTTGEFGVRFSQQLYANLFYDAGNVWATAAGFNPTRLFRGAGVGVSLITPLGPLGLDYAYGFDRVNALGQPTPGWKLHFRIGNFF
jgi:outer membrane protein insertion porin family